MLNVIETNESVSFKVAAIVPQLRPRRPTATKCIKGLDRLSGPLMETLPLITTRGYLPPLCINHSATEALMAGVITGFQPGEQRRPPRDGVGSLTGPSSSKKKIKNRR